MYKLTIILLILLSPLHLFSEEICQLNSCTMKIQQQPGKILKLREVLLLVATGNPELAASHWDKKVGEAAVLKAEQWQNPRLNFVLEDFAGSGNYNDTSQAQATILINQLIELGGKRAARKNLAGNFKSLSDLEYEIKKLEIITSATNSFYDVVAKQEDQKVLNEEYDFTKKTLAKIKKQVAAGKSSTLELKKVEINLSQLEIEKEHVEHLLAMSKLALASAWGAKEVLFERASSDIFKIRNIPNYNQLLKKLSESMLIKRWLFKRKAAQSEVELARANRISNLTFGLGIRRYEAFDDQALVAELSLPLPLFNRNEGQIAEARALKSKAIKLQEDYEVKINELLFELFQELKHAELEMQSSKDSIIPNAREVLVTASEGFHLGRFSYLELSDAQSILSKARQDYIAAALEYQKTYAEIHQLLGISSVESNQF